MAATKNLLSYESGGNLTQTLPSLAGGSAWETAVVDNSTNKFLDDLVTVTFTIITGTPTSNGPYVNIYAAGSADGTIFPKTQLSNGAPYQTGGGSGSVGAIGNPPNLRLIGSMALQTTASAAERTFITEPMSVAKAFGGVLPQKYSIIVENQTGLALSSSTTTTANNVAHQPISTTSGN